MSKIILVAETGADIPPELARRHNIRLVPMHASFGNETKDDGTFPREEICAYYERTGVLPKTSGSMPEDFNRVFDDIHAEQPDAQILHLGYSAVTSCSYQSACIAAEGREYVTSIDSKFVSFGQGVIVVKLAEMLEQYPQWGMDEAVAAANALIRRTRMAFLPNDMEYLRAGGRVSNAAALCGRLLGIHPLIEIIDGCLTATKKPRGRMKVLAPLLVPKYAADKALERGGLWLLWGPGFPDEVKASVERSAQHCGFKKVTWVPTGGVITTHGGPGAFGIVGFSSK